MMFSSPGPGNCIISLSTSRVTPDSAVIRWDIHSCLGTVATNYSIQWHTVGGLVASNATLITTSSINEYRITGLSPGTRYYILMHPQYFVYCGLQVGNWYSALVETESGELYPCTFEQKHVTCFMLENLYYTVL